MEACPKGQFWVEPGCSRVRPWSAIKLPQGPEAREPVEARSHRAGPCQTTILARESASLAQRAGHMEIAAHSG